MIKRLQGLAAARLLGQSFQSDGERYLRPMLAVADVFALAVHGYFFCVFWGWRIAALAWANLLGVVLYALSLRLLRTRRYGPAGLLGTAWGLLYAALFGAAGMGACCAVYFALLAGVQILVPYGTARLRTAAAVLCTAGVSWSLLAGPPATPLPPGLETLLRFSHAYLLLLGFLVGPGASVLIRQAIQQLSDARMAELSSQAYLDPLTGLYNRRYADRYFQVLPPGEKTDVVAILDVDDFKQVNDRLGHSCGDEVLSFVAAFLRQHTRKTDITFRWGGEEFLIILSDIGPQAARQVLEKLRRELSEAPIQTGDGPVSITVTIGMAPLRYEDVLGSIRESDDRLCEGKRGGKNRVVAPGVPQEDPCLLSPAAPSRL